MNLDDEVARVLAAIPLPCARSHYPLPVVPVSDAELDAEFFNVGATK